jgi:prolyl-tRNA synthetase
MKLKEIADVTSRCLPFGEQGEDGVCICCGKKTDKMVYWGKAY